MLLKGKKALVTGGARGIGKEIVLDFLREVRHKMSSHWQTGGTS